VFRWGPFFLYLEDLHYVLYLAECVLIIKYVDRVFGSVVVKPERAFVFVKSGEEVSSSLSRGPIGKMSNVLPLYHKNIYHQFLS
jgi:hypothetical protein